MQQRQQLYTAAVTDKDAYQVVPSDTLRSLIKEGLEEDVRAKKARADLGLPGEGGPEHSVLASLLQHYQSRWSKREGLLYYIFLLQVPAEGGVRQEVLQRHHDNPITGQFCAR